MLSLWVPLAATIALSGGLRLDAPLDYPTQLGLSAEARWLVLDSGYLGLTTSWAGGVNEQNPNRLRIAQRIEAAAILGARLPMQGWGLTLGSRAGLMGVFGWPRGFLTNLQNDWGPWLAAELRADWPLSDAWVIEPSLGIGGVRLVGDWLPVPFLGLSFTRLVP
jgi:hypothetical protein